MGEDETYQCNIIHTTYAALAFLWWSYNISKVIIKVWNEVNKKKKTEYISCLYVSTTRKKYITLLQICFTTRITNQPLRESTCRKITTERAKTTFSQDHIGSIYDFGRPLKCLCATIAGINNDIFFATTHQTINMLLISFTIKRQ